MHTHSLISCECALISGAIPCGLVCPEGSEVCSSSVLVNDAHVCGNEHTHKTSALRVCVWWFSHTQHRRIVHKLNT